MGSITCLLYVSASGVAGEGVALLRVLCQVKALDKSGEICAKAAILWTAGRDSSFISLYACRMDPVREQLQRLNRELDDLTAKIEVAQDNWLKAQDSQEKASLQKVYDVLTRQIQDCRSERRDLQLKLPSSGKHCVTCLCISAFARQPVGGIGICATLSQGTSCAPSSILAADMTRKPRACGKMECSVHAGRKASTFRTDQNARLPD